MHARLGNGIAGLGFKWRHRLAQSPVTAMAYHVEVGGPVHLYAREIPAGAMAVGVIRSDDGVAGALLRFRNGAYAQMNDVAIRALDRLEVLRAMSQALQAVLKPAHN